MDPNDQSLFGHLHRALGNADHGQVSPRTKKTCEFHRQHSVRACYGNRQAHHTRSLEICRAHETGMTALKLPRMYWNACSTEVSQRLLKLLRSHSFTRGQYTFVLTNNIDPDVRFPICLNQNVRLYRVKLKHHRLCAYHHVEAWDARHPIWL